MLVGRKYRLAFTPEQAEFAEAIGNACRSVWNTGLEQRRAYRKRGAWISYAQQAAELAEAKHDHEWLKSAPAHVLQQTLIDLERACKEHGTWRIKWRSKARWSPSFRFPDSKQITVRRLGRRWGQCKLPKFGWVKFRWSRAVGGEIRSATVSRCGRDWFVSFLVEDGKVVPEQHSSARAVGVDRGVAVAIACSDSTTRDRQFRTEGEQRRYLRLQQCLNRQLRGSANRKKTIASICRIKRRERDRRRDFVAWTGNRLATSNGVVVLEDLKIRGMTRSAKGTLAQPGTWVSQKTGLNRSILDKGWYQLELALRNVARYTGCRIVKVPAAYTSQRCSACRTVDPGNRKSQAVFRCTTCGHEENADVNAAKNVLADGLSVSACGDFGVARSAKQEPARNREAVSHQSATALVGIPGPSSGRTSRTLGRSGVSR